ncbi:type VII secretion-associated serine protease mycosin [Actinacidiphila acidipaludis]|uniref:Type VII secretion-associated serine protease mycosin n=1 Tax=Actinacidiphila acidipaludis TaxID=2873382 RepID=A0ABS7QD94_9ACTN|nr:type VII secretion-associated serine protease mycosin [Streptomyces acidipaludis]MBY8879932.1 type VII secretion-associated serine protease mycosin [Streptomyces acidipaludis]
MAGAGLAGADTIRMQEWPLDSAHFQADRIWDLSRGRGVTVAVIDSGVDAGHPDLVGQVLPGTSFLGDTDDDGRNDSSSDSHGTAIAGIIAGTGKADGGTGMIGLAPGSTILPVKVALGAAVQATALAEGIKYAADHRAQVINVSLGTQTPDPLLRQAVTYALGKGSVIVAAAGNEGNSGNPPLYPAAFPGVVDVTGITDSGAFWPVSESGPQTTLAAPATGIFSTNNQGQYVNAEGTSYATAYVSAAAALVRSAHPGLTPGQVIRRLITTARPTGGKHAHSDQFGFGLLDPLAALQASPSVDGSPANPLLSSYPPGAAPAPHGGPPWKTLAAVGTALAGLAAAGTVLFTRRRRRVHEQNRRKTTASPPAATANGKRRTPQARRSPDKAAASRKAGKSGAGQKRGRPPRTVRR